MNAIVNAEVRERNISRLRERNIVLPTFAQLADPSTIPPEIRRALQAIDPDAPHPLNLFRVHWAPGAHIVLPSSLTGVDAKILVLLGNRRVVQRFEAHGDAVVLVAERDLSRDALAMEATHVLSADSGTVYVALRMIPYGVLALRTDDLEKVYRYEAPAPVRSMAFLPDALVFGMNDSVTLVRLKP